MAPLRAFEYRVLRYAPNSLQDVAANVGVILVEVGQSGDGFADVRLTQDWRMARVLDPQFDFEYFVEFERRLRAQLNSNAMVCSSGGVPMTEREWILHIIEDGFSNGLQVSKPKGVMSEDPAAALERLVKQHCELVRIADESSARTLTGRSYLKHRVAEEFRLAGLENVVRRDIEASKYTSKGGRLKIDFGYTYPPLGADAAAAQGGDIRLFHAVSLENDPKLAEVLAFRWAALHEGILKAGHQAAELTAVIEDGLGPHVARVSVELETMMEAGLIVRSVSQAPEIAAQARRDLQM